MKHAGKRVFATRNAKLVLRDEWSSQNMHGHRPIELIVGLDGPVRLKSDTVEICADCVMVPPMRQHAILDYAGRIARIYLDTGYRRLTYWKAHDIKEMHGQAKLKETLEGFFLAHEKSMSEAQTLIESWIAAWIGFDGEAPPCDPRVAAVLKHLDEQTTSIYADRCFDPRWLIP